MKSRILSSFIFVIVLLCGCASRYAIYQPMGKGEALQAPPDLRDGTATLYEVKQWASTMTWPENAKLEFENKDLNLDGRDELLVSTPAWAGTGGNKYLVFEKTSRGYRFLGDVWFGAIRPIAKLANVKTVLITFSHSSAGSGTVSLLTLDAEGFHTLGQAEIRAGDSGTEEGNRIANELFGTGPVSSGTLEHLFGAACPRLANN